MYYRDHPPPHFHAMYGGQEATIDVERLVVLEGNLSRRALNLVLDWAELHQPELMRNWLFAQQHEPLIQVRPLE